VRQARARHFPCSCSTLYLLWRTIPTVRVWIDQDQCVGNGVCEELCPEVFYLADGDLAYVREGDHLLPKGREGMGVVPPGLEDAVLDAVDQCPTECIFVEAD
jgi:ferredoxin